MNSRGLTIFKFHRLEGRETKDSFMPSYCSNDYSNNDGCNNNNNNNCNNSIILSFHNRGCKHLENTFSTPAKILRK